MRNAISSFLLPEFKPVNGSEHLNTGRPLTLERIAAESWKPKNASNWDVHYLKKICDELGIKMDDIQNSEAPFSAINKFILENLDQLPSTCRVRMPTHSISTYGRISEAKQIILSQHSFSTLKNTQNLTLIFEKLDKKYLIVNAALTLSLALISGGLAFYFGASTFKMLFFVGLTAAQHASFLYFLCYSNYTNMQSALNRILNLQQGEINNAHRLNQHNIQEDKIAILIRELTFSEQDARDLSHFIQTHPKMWRSALACFFISTFARMILSNPFISTPLSAFLYWPYIATELFILLYVSSFHLIDMEKSIVYFHYLRNLFCRDNIILGIHNIEKMTNFLVHQNKGIFDFISIIINIQCLQFYIISLFVSRNLFVPYGCSINIAVFLFVHLFSLSIYAAMFLSGTVFSFAFAQNLNNLQKDYTVFFKDISSIPPASSQLSSETTPSVIGSNTVCESIDTNEVFKLVLPYLSPEDKRNIGLCSRNMNNIIRENTHFFNIKSLNRYAFIDAFPYIEKVKIDSAVYSWDINNALRTMQHLNAIEIGLSAFSYMNFGDINLDLRQKITHLTCYGQQIVNSSTYAPLSCFPQLTHLTVLNPRNENFDNFICNSTLLPALKSLTLKQELGQPTLQQIAWPRTLHELKLEGLSNEKLPEFPRYLTILSLDNLRELNKMPKLPRYLISLYLSHLDSLAELTDSDIGQFPEDLTTLSLIHLRYINFIPPFPKNLTSFSFAGSQRINEQEQFSERLTSFLSFTRLICLNGQRQFPRSLTSLDIDTPDFKMHIRPENHPDTL